MLTIRIVHEHRLDHKGAELLMTISAAFQAQVDRLGAYVESIKGGAVAQDAENTAALAAKLDAEGAPPAPAPGDEQPTG